MKSLHLIWLAGLFAGLCQAANDTQPISIFRSRPDLVSPILVQFTRNASLQAPGYYFISPYQQIQESVYIYDNDANLVWTGFGGAGPGISHAPRVCQYQGEPHLCFYQGTQMIGWGHGHGVIMDKHYRIVKSVEPSGSYQASSDMHEFYVINDGKTALMTQYLRSVYDLCPWNLCDGLGYIQQGAFQEIDVETGKVLFEWQSLDHVNPDESYVLPSSTEISGSGEYTDSPWDYFHINAVDKNSDGDYLVSARHVSAVYKISGKDGHVIWRLNGAKSDYYLDGFGFAFQHDARFISDTEDETIISLFDNGSNGFNQTQPFSTGKIISIDHKTKVATLIKSIEPPIINGGQHISKSQGNFQQLKNGNSLLGWGNDAFWTEYAPNGEVAFYGSIGWENVMNYRVYKFDNWVGLPLTKPAIWTYSKYGGSNDGMFIYTSWNGATEVRFWRLVGSQSKDGPWTEIDVVDKYGFETVVQHPSTWQYVYAEALDADKLVLGTTMIQTTFIPNIQMLDYCDEVACKFMPSPDERERQRIEAEEAAAAKAAEEKAAAEAAEAQAKATAEAARLAAETRKKWATVFGSTVGGIVLVLLLLAACLSTRSPISKPVHQLRHRVWGFLTHRADSEKSGHYRAVALEDQDGDQTPMIAHAT